MGFFDKLKSGLGKTRESFSDKVNSVFKVFTKIDEEFFDELEEALITADLGVETSVFVIEELRRNVKSKHITDSEEVKNELKNIISDILTSMDCSMHLDTKPSVVLVIGVNGVGKTTSIGKLASL